MTNDRLQILARFIRNQVALADRPPPGCIQLNNDEALLCAEAIERVIKPAHEREPPHCSSCSCGAHEPSEKPACKCGRTWTAADCPVHGDPAALTAAARPSISTPVTVTSRVVRGGTWLCVGCGNHYALDREKCPVCDHGDAEYSPGLPVNREGD